MKARTRRRTAALAVLAAAGALVLAACGSDGKGSSTTTPASAPGASTGTIVAGSADFPESQLLMEIYAQQLEKNGYKVERKPAIGAREVYFKAISADPPEINLVPEYTNSLLSFVVKSKDANATITATNVQEQITALGEALPATLVVGTPSTAEDKDVIVCTKDVADKYSLKTLSDLAKVSSEIALGAPPEFETRSPFGIPGFKELYGATFKSFVPLKIGDIPAALDAGQIDCGNLFSTMSVITTANYVALEDDKVIVPNEAVLPLMTKSIATPEVLAIVDGVSAKLNTDNLKKMMVEIEVDKKAPDVVAKEFVATL
ncbi:MAG: ABC transporter substrate-binding protein [Ilumatobacteraceae bacterium]